MDRTPKFDVSYHSDRVSLDYHFCRGWSGDVGCYGANPDHGCTFDEAKETIAQWHEQEAKRWRAMTYEEWR
jgi:hypothetical protein